MCLAGWHGVQISSSIRYIHSKKILHRDLKTQNIFIAKGGIIKLGDFGISKASERMPLL